MDTPTSKRSKALVKGSPSSESGPEDSYIEVQPHPVGISIKIPPRFAQSGEPFILPLPPNLREAVLDVLFKLAKPERNN